MRTTLQPRRIQRAMESVMNMTRLLELDGFEDSSQVVDGRPFVESWKLNSAKEFLHDSKSSRIMNYHIQEAIIENYMMD